MTFRTDINGLRAIAVIAVVLFHFNPNLIQGGFVGVDIFFVISGFLMTGIIFKGITNNNFSLIKFYVARANRIIPALAVLGLILFIFGWFFLSLTEYKMLGKHIANSMIFFSNHTYLNESGYFDVASNEKWLLHTWSLSVEWQFYIVYPLVILFLKKFLSISKIKVVLIYLTLLGFITGLVVTFKSPDAAYYLLPTRAWEMMVGGLIYLYPVNLNKTNQQKFEWLGITLILVSYVFISSSSAWPGYLALLPVLGTSFVIIANNQHSRLTNNLVFQKIGKWSYSIYLWHWPLVVWGYQNDISHWIYIGVPLSILFGYLSFRFIEFIQFRSVYNEYDVYLQLQIICLQEEHHIFLCGL